MSNAFRYTSQKVGLKLTVTAQDLKMSIGDDGTGFQENIDTVTQAFYHENSQDDLKHFGMGMYISRIYYERHGGKLLIKMQQMVVRKLRQCLKLCIRENNSRNKWNCCFLFNDL